MSQQQPEPIELAGNPPEPAGTPEEIADIPTTPIETSVPMTPPVAPPAPPVAVPAAPKGPDLWRMSLEWMRKSQEITVKLLYDLGGWVFGGLIVAALMLLQALIALGFADRATLVAGFAISIALPFNLAGLGIIRYFTVLNQAVEEARRALAQSPNLDAKALTRLTQESDSFSPGKRKIMDSSLALTLYLSILFTLIGSCSALWRISWAATLLFLIACVVSFYLVLRVIRSS